jgi:hypothetical protein
VSVSQMEKGMPTVGMETKVLVPEVKKEEGVSNFGPGKVNPRTGQIDTCWRCGSTEHWKRDCPVPPRKMNKPEGLNQ